MPDDSTNLPLSLSSDEMAILVRAAAAAGKDKTEIADWAREILLNHVRSLPIQPIDEELTGGIKILPAPAAPTCFCGETRDPKGACDGSCIMRY